MRSVHAGLVCLLLGSAGCYHATIETGATPSAETVEKAWASGWIYGLVPPSTLSTAARCTSGVAKVETQLSFANQLVSLLTLGIFTPMHIKVTCAARRHASGDSAATIRVGVDAATPEEAMQQAVERSRREGKPVEVEFQAK